jgi:pyocin large subunit-like protein
MSETARKWAWLVEGLTSAQKIVLVALADLAHVEAEVFLCQPSHAALAELTGLSTRTVQRSLDALDAAGLISRQNWSGSNLYVVHVDLWAGEP